MFYVDSGFCLWYHFPSVVLSAFTRLSLYWSSATKINIMLFAVKYQHRFLCSVSILVLLGIVSTQVLVLRQYCCVIWYKVSTQVLVFRQYCCVIWYKVSTQVLVLRQYCCAIWYKVSTQVLVFRKYCCVIWV